MTIRRQTDRQTEFLKHFPARGRSVKKTSRTHLRVWKSKVDNFKENPYSNFSKFHCISTDYLTVSLQLIQCWGLSVISIVSKFQLRVASFCVDLVKQSSPSLHLREGAETRLKLRGNISINNSYWRIPIRVVCSRIASLLLVSLQIRVDFRYQSEIDWNLHLNAYS